VLHFQASFHAPRTRRETRTLALWLTFCFSLFNATAEEVIDVTRRYTVDYDTVVTKRRRSIREAVLAKVKMRPVFLA